MKKTKRKHPPSFLGGPAALAALRRGSRHVGISRVHTRAYIVRELERWMRAHEAAASAHAVAAAQLVRAQAERDEVAALLRRAIGVIADVERTRGEAAAVLDRYAELWPIGGRL